MSSQSLPKYGQFFAVMRILRICRPIFLKEQDEKNFRFFISIPRWEKDKNYFTLYCPSKKACALRNFVCNQPNEMEHLFRSSVETRCIEENPGTPTPLYSFVNVSHWDRCWKEVMWKRPLLCVSPGFKFRFWRFWCKLRIHATKPHLGIGWGCSIEGGGWALDFPLFILSKAISYTVINPGKRPKYGCCFKCCFYKRLAE